MKDTMLMARERHSDGVQQASAGGSEAEDRVSSLSAQAIALLSADERSPPVNLVRSEGCSDTPSSLVSLDVRLCAHERVRTEVWIDERPVAEFDCMANDSPRMTIPACAFRIPIDAKTVTLRGAVAGRWHVSEYDQCWRLYDVATLTHPLHQRCLPIGERLRVFVDNVIQICGQRWPQLMAELGDRFAVAPLTAEASADALLTVVLRGKLTELLEHLVVRGVVGTVRGPHLVIDSQAPNGRIQLTFVSRGKGYSGRQAKLQFCGYESF